MPHDHMGPPIESVTRLLVDSSEAFFHALDRSFMLYNVIDARRPDWKGQGPFSKEEATKLAQDLSDFVYRNSAMAAIMPNAKVTGPFYIKAV